MLVVLPTHNGDRNLTVNLSAHIARLGGVKNHECLIVCPQQTNLDGIENVLREAFGRLFVYRYTETMQGWPFGPNEAASIAMMHCAINPELRYHYLMLEPDCVPTTRFWLDMIDMDYRRCGKQVLGVRVPTVEIATGRQVGMHVVGVAVYPKNFAATCPLVKSLVSMTSGYKNQGGMPMPWDAYFGPYTARMVADTTLIQHLSRQRNVDEHGRVTWDCPSLENAIAQVNPQAVLIHGSKDPNFLTAITSPQLTPQPIQNHAPQVRSQERVQEHPRDAQGKELRQGDEPPRQESRKQDGGSGSPASQQGQEGVLTTTKERLVVPPKDYMNFSQVPRVRARQIAEAEKIRKQLGIEFPLNTPEFARARYFHFSVKWTDVRSYASQLGLKIFKKNRGQIINEVVKKEIEDGKEEWVKEVVPKAEPAPAAVADVPHTEPTPPLPPVALEDAPAPVGFGVSTAVTTAVPWKPVDSTGRLIESPSNITPLPDAKQEQMRRMLAERGYRATA